MNLKPEVVEQLERVLASVDQLLPKAAIKWAQVKSKRCGRTALQFARHWLGQHLLDTENGTESSN